MKTSALFVIASARRARSFRQQNGVGEAEGPILLSCRTNQPASGWLVNLYGDCFASLAMTMLTITLWATPLQAAGQKPPSAEKTTFQTAEPQPPQKIACPQCRQSASVIPIVYGLPGKALMDEAEEGKVKLGGCIVSNQNPQWHCKTCDKDW